MRPLSALLFGLLILQGHAASAAARETPSAVTASGRVTDLLALYRESRLEDPRILAAHARAESAREQEREAFGQLLPQVSANSASNRVLRKDSRTREHYDSGSYALSLTQYLYDKSTWERYQRSRSVTAQLGAQADDSLAEATVDLAQRYFAALAADDELDLIMAERRATQNSLDRVSALYERKMAMVTDLLDLRARVDSLAAQEVEARNQVRLSRAALAEIIGRPIDERLARIRTDVTLQAPGQTLESWVTEALEGNPALKSRRNGVEAAQAAVREGKGGHYPSVTFSLSAQQSDVGYDNTQSPRSDSYVASLGVRVPIYSGGSTSARVRGLYNEQVAAEEEFEAIRRQVVKETTSAYLTAQSSVDKIRAGQHALSSAQQSSIAAQKAFSYGVVNSVDVLTAVQNEFRARRDLLKAQYDFATNLFALNRWGGRLNEQAVESVNVWLRDEEPKASEQDLATAGKRP